MISLLPKARQAEIGRQFWLQPNLAMEKASMFHMIEGDYTKAFWEGKGVSGSLRGFMADP